MVTPTRIHAAPVALLLLAACAPAEEPRVWEIADSAGVRIATNLVLDAPEWRLGEQPRLDLGRLEGGGPEEFHRVASGRVLDDGRIGVVNTGMREVRIFGPDGEHLLSFGREGEGPGEFRFPTLLWQIRGDSLVVWDPRLRRFNVFSSAGAFGRSATLHHPVANPHPLVVFPDGRSVVRGDEFDLSGSGFQQMYSSYLHLDATGSVLDTLPRQRLAVMGWLTGTQMVAGPLFGPRTETAGSEDGYWVGLGHEEEILRYGWDGSLRAVVRWPAVDRSVEEGDAERMLRSQIARMSEEDRRRARRLHEERPVADRFPSHGMLIEDDEGRLWVQEYERPDHEGSSRWMIFDGEGRLTGRVTIPADHRILDIGRDHLLAVGVDDLGIEHVRLFELETAGGPSSGATGS